MWNLFDRQDLKGDGICPPYLISRRLFRCRWLAVYLHQFLDDDWAKDLHDHPYAMISIGLWGGYDEVTKHAVVRWRAPWIRWFKATHAHRIRLKTKSCWTLAIALPGNRPWGFWQRASWIPAETYLKPGHAKQRGCE